ncbi:MAG TPA: VOC family protein [Vicinamibacterales bacterium]|nr:VOC family protein [Vicinamibacterales bacterium]
MAKRIDGRVEIGHVHLKVADLERSIAFYQGVLGFEVMQRWGTSAAFLSAGGYHHHIGLNTWESLGGPAPAHGTTGLYHFAVRYPDRASLGDALRRLREAGVPLDGASDHGVSEAIYLRDPDGNGLELYRDRPNAEWPRAADGSLQMGSAPLDVAALLKEADAEAAGPASSPTGASLLTEPTRQRLNELRPLLLNLHKVLLDDARTAYELDRGRVGTTANLLQLVINDPWFAWLHSLSELIVRIDELVRKDAPATEGDAAVLFGEVERLLTASETGDGFQKRYFEALQRQPAVVLAHAEVRRTLKALRE